MKWSQDQYNYIISPRRIQYERVIHIKLPNGYGSISKLPGNRRCPWRVRKTDGWELVDGKAKQKFINVGCFETKALALQALANYNDNPYDPHSKTITFEEVYDKWSEKKFEKIDPSNVNGYKASYKLCKAIYKMKFSELKLSHLQGVVDSSEKQYPTLKKLKTLFSQLFDYAVMHNIISKNENIVEYVDIGEPTKSTKHYRFTPAEIDTMWKWSKNNEYIQVILMLIYSGVRPGELFDVKKSKVNLEEKWFFVEKGKNTNATRKVPIHEKTFSFFEHWMNKPDTEYLVTLMNGKKVQFDTKHGQYTNTYWKPLLSDMGILQYTNANGEIKEHVPDDTRHTFTTIWKEKKLDEAMRRKIQGHSGKGIGEIVYTHFELEKLREELNQI